MKPKDALNCCGPIDDWLDAAFFKALGEPTRLKLLACLAKCGRACSVTEFAECCTVDFSVVTRHLAVLDQAGILASAKQGRTVYYEVHYRHLSEALRSLSRGIAEFQPKRAASSPRRKTSIRPT